MITWSLVSTVQAARGVMVWGILSTNNLSLLAPTNHHLSTTALSIVAYHARTFMATVYQSSDHLKLVP